MKRLLLIFCFLSSAAIAQTPNWGNVSPITGLNNLYYYLGMDTSSHHNAQLGWLAGTYINDGVTLNSASIASVYIGYDAQAKQQHDTDEIVIGQNGSGGGSYTAVIGDGKITATYFHGEIIDRNNTKQPVLLHLYQATGATDVAIDSGGGYTAQGSDNIGIMYGRTSGSAGLELEDYANSNAWAQYADNSLCWHLTDLRQSAVRMWIDGSGYVTFGSTAGTGANRVYAGSYYVGTALQKLVTSVGAAGATIGSVGTTAVYIKLVTLSDGTTLNVLTSDTP